MSASRKPTVTTDAFRAALLTGRRLEGYQSTILPAADIFPDSDMILVRHHLEVAQQTIRAIITPGHDDAKTLATQPEMLKLLHHTPAHRLVGVAIEGHRMRFKDLDAHHWEAAGFTTPTMICSFKNRHDLKPHDPVSFLKLDCTKHAVLYDPHGTGYRPQIRNPRFGITAH